MKIPLSRILVVLLMANCLWAQQNSFPTRQWTATLKIIDESGEPVTGAYVEAGYIIMPIPPKERWGFGDRGGTIDGLTDTHGLFTATHTDRSPSLGFLVQKRGYYKTHISREIGFPEQNAILGNIEISLALKKIGKPLAMYAKSLNTYVPGLDVPVGYDLEVGDWVGSHGRGKAADILFTGHFDKYTNGESDFTLTVSFPNKDDGIQEFIVPDNEKGSALRSAHEAPKDGYKSRWIQIDKRAPRKPIQTNRDPDRNYYFRVRTVVDENGNIVSANYGKIYGDFMKFTYYLNPRPNDRNVEFDPRHNLIHDLSPLEQVRDP